MLASLAFVTLFGVLLAAACRKMRIPRMIGMLLVGVLLGPFVLNLLDGSLLGISSDLRQIALIIILLKAGLSLNVADLRKVGRPALLMSFLPAVFEIAGVVLLAPHLLGVSRTEACIIGAVLGAVSPAVVVPKMVELLENRYGTDKSIPQLILAAASLDDVFVIILFSTFVGMEQGKSATIRRFIDIPSSIVLGIALGILIGFLLSLLFELAHKNGKSIRGSMKVIVILALSFLLVSAEKWLEPFIAVSGLLAVMAMACTIQMRCRPEVGTNLAGKFGKLWILAEVLLFVLVGAAVDIRYTMKAGLPALFLILLVLLFRSVGVVLSLIGTNLSIKERLFCVIAYLPKATVQAAIGAVPLTLGLPCGNTVLSVAVLSIIVTAPLGAFGMDLAYKKLLHHEA